MANTKQQDTKEPMNMTFAQARMFFNKLDEERAVGHRLGMYTAHIIFRRKLYVFRKIKMNASGSADIFGFGMNHYFWMPGNRIDQMPTKTSIFYDSEDVSFSITEDQFVSAELSTGKIAADKTGQFVTIQTKKWKAIISWGPVQYNSVVEHVQQISRNMSISQLLQAKQV